MTLGTGVFLSAVVLGLIQLYLQTGDRWRWRRIVGVIAALAVLVPIGAVGIWWASDFEKSRPHKVTKFLNIEIGMPKEDVKFLMGKPDQMDNKLWIYFAKDYKPPVFVEFYAGKVDKIGTIGASDVVLSGVRMDDDYQSVVARLGKPTVVDRSNDNLSRTLYYPSIGVAIGMSGGKVEYLAAYGGHTNAELVD